jgi:two-component system response regulator AdeR
MSPFALIIEDEDDAATIFSAALQTGGFTTEIIRDGAVAQARLANVTPDVVILDLHLPRVKGTDVLHQILADERLAETRVIVVSADPRLADTLRDQVDLVLIKPIAFSHLRDLARRLVSPFHRANGQR